MAFITLTTDFGHVDGYVGAMKGVILSIAPSAIVVDISHGIPPQDLRAAAWVLYTAYDAFPQGAVHCVVVDPGVGSQRRAIGVEAGGYVFVAPDNGVLSYVLAREPPTAVVELTNRRYHHHPVSHTFHGRDVFAPAAAYLARGTTLGELGSPVDDPVTWPHPGPQWRSDGMLQGHILYIDHFGNCITDLRLRPDAGGWLLVNRPAGDPETLTIRPHQVRLSVGETVVPEVSCTYADGSPGELLALVGSSGHLEIACVEGNAARVLGVALGDTVVVDLEGR